MFKSNNFKFKVTIHQSGSKINTNVIIFSPIDFFHLHVHIQTIINFKTKVKNVVIFDYFNNIT